MGFLLLPFSFLFIYFNSDCNFHRVRVRSLMLHLKCVCITRPKQVCRFQIQALTFSSKAKLGIFLKSQCCQTAASIWVPLHRGQHQRIDVLPGRLLQLTVQPQPCNIIYLLPTDFLPRTAQNQVIDTKTKM